MTARSIRRAAERKAKKASEKEARLQPTEMESTSEARLAANRANCPTFYRPSHPGRQSHLFYELG